MLFILEHLPLLIFFRKPLRRLPGSRCGVFFTSSFQLRRPRTTASMLDRTAIVAGRSDIRFDGWPGFVPPRWDTKRHPGRRRVAAAVGGGSGWGTGGRLPIMSDRRRGCESPIARTGPASPLAREYAFRRETTSASGISVMYRSLCQAGAAAGRELRGRAVDRRIYSHSAGVRGKLSAVNFQLQPGVEIDS